MSLEAVAVLNGFRNESWAETDVVVGGADPPVKHYVNDRRVIPITVHVLESTTSSKCLVDCPGGGLLVYKISPKGGVLTSTWSVLCFATDGRETTLRAFKGPAFNLICKHAQSDTIMSAGQAPGKPDQEALAYEARLKFPAQMRKLSLAQDQVTLHGWAMRELVQAADRMVLGVEHGGGGLARNRIKADGFFDVVASSTPNQPRIGAALAGVNRSANAARRDLAGMLKDVEVQIADTPRLIHLAQVQLAVRMAKQAASAPAVLEERPTCRRTGRRARARCAARQRRRLWWSSST